MFPGSTPFMFANQRSPVFIDGQSPYIRHGAFQNSSLFSPNIPMGLQTLEPDCMHAKIDKESA
jgi:hypothetical protein